MTSLPPSDSRTVPESSPPASAGGSWLESLRAALGGVLVGQRELVDSLIIGLLTGGHILLEGVPGLAKSLSVSCLAQAVNGTFSRLQFTPDLLPSDLVGTEIYNAKTGEFSVRRGPLFANFILADEVNRAPAKVQSALLEAMQERQVSIGGESFLLPRPFVVLATQNPIEQEGTYPLPEAQLDRFALKVVVDYPDRAEELAILDRMGRTSTTAAVRPVVDLEQVLAAGRMVDAITLDPRLQEYIVSLVLATRDPAGAGLGELAAHIHYGGSPRATVRGCSSSVPTFRDPRASLRACWQPTGSTAWKSTSVPCSRPPRLCTAP